MKKISIGKCLAGIIGILTIAIFIMLLVYSSKGGVVAGTVYAALVIAVLCEAAALFGEKSWTDFTSILGAVALSFVLMKVFSDGIWNIAESINGIKMVGMPELAGMNYQLAALNLVALVIAIVNSFVKK